MGISKDSILIKEKEQKQIEISLGLCFSGTFCSLPFKLIRKFRLIEVSGKLPTFPSPKPSFFPKWEVSVIVSLGAGFLGSFSETLIDPKVLSYSWY